MDVEKKSNSFENFNYRYEKFPQENHYNFKYEAKDEYKNKDDFKDNTIKNYNSEGGWTVRLHLMIIILAF